MPDRYHRQSLLPEIREPGTRALRAARVTIVGCGALGTVTAELLARAGIGTLRLIDRDLVELTNLQRQMLFDERDVNDGLPKAVAAARRLAAINGEVRLEPVVCDVDSDNVERLVLEPRSDLILDGTDNAETRYLINDVAVKHGIPWVYGAAIATVGRVMPIRPNAGPCLRCVFPQPPAAGELPTCDTAGVLGPVTATVGALQAAAAIRMLVMPADRSHDRLVTLDLWTTRLRASEIADLRVGDCPCCGKHRWEYLGRPSRGATSLCGRSSVQVRGGGAVPLPQLAERLAVAGEVLANEHLLRFSPREDGGLQLTLFPDGRAIVHGTSDPSRARTLYARFVGS